MPFSIVQAVTVVSDAPAAQTTNMAASPQPALEQESIASTVPAAANDLAAAPADDQEAVNTAENQVSDIPAIGETVTDSVAETEGLTVTDPVASIIPVEEGVVESAVTEAVVLEAAAATNGETDPLAPAADVIINIVATDATVVQTVPSIVPVIDGEIVESVNEVTPNEVIAEAPVITDTATGEDVLLVVQSRTNSVCFGGVLSICVCVIPMNEISTHFPVLGKE